MKQSYTKLIVPAVGLTMVAFGLHQIIRPNAWTSYLPDSLADQLPLKKRSVLRIHGLGNLTLGTIYTSGYGFWLMRWFVPAWWAFMVPFCGRHNWRNGLRDICIMSAALSVALDSSSQD